jgi:hypothetical protein
VKTVDGKSYQVGYRKPPKATRFKPGTSGNPKGRPRGRKNLATILGKILNEKVTIKAGDSVKEVTKGEAMIMTTMNRALKGDDRAVTTLFKLARETGQLEPIPLAANDPIADLMNEISERGTRIFDKAE